MYVQCVPMTTTRNSALDGLRGVAIALVVAHHATAFLWPGTFGRWLPGGFLGVDLFFVLSGYLITSLILDRRDKGERGLKLFYMRRVLRIVPPLAFMLVGVGAYTLITGGMDEVGSVVYSGGMTLFNFASWILNFYPTWIPGKRWLSPIGIGWSLAVEEQFYVVWPAILLALLALRRSRAFIFTLTVLGVGAFTARSIDLWYEHHSWVNVYFRVDTRGSELLVGAALAMFLWRRPPLRSTRILSVAAAVLFAGFIALNQTADATSSWLYLGGFTAIAIGCAIIVAAAADGRPTLCRVLSFPPLVGLGRVSYAVYLWHYPVFWLVEHNTTPHFWGRTFLGFGITAVAVAVSWFALEIPAARIRRRLEHRPAREPAPQWAAPTSAVLSAP